MNQHPTQSSYRPGRRRLKLVLFGGLAGAAVTLLCGGFAVLLFRDPLPDLTPEQLAAARQLWQANGPDSYDLDVQLGGDSPGVIHVEVRDGDVVTPPTRNGTPIAQRHTWRVWTVPGQFETIERELELAADPQREMQSAAPTQLYLGARFHPQLGYPLRYRRLVSGQGPQVEWAVTKFEAVPSRR